MSSQLHLAEGQPDKLNTQKPLRYDFQVLEEFFESVLDPESMSVFLEEIEEQYISYLLKHPEQPGETAEHQVYYLRKLRKAMQKINRLG